ncbi:MAG: thioredoxin-like domain-containing protein [Bacteroidota bacterium]
MKKSYLRFLSALLLIILSQSSQNAYSQRTRVKGQVVSAVTYDPIPYASVGIYGSYRGTSANSEGEFSLLVQDGDILRISSLGYKTKTVEVSGPHMKVVLQEDVKVLNTVMIHSNKVNPSQIVKKAFENIHKNFISEPFTMKTFYRHYCKDDSLYGRLIEAAVDVYKPTGYGKPKSDLFVNDAIQLVQSRRTFDKTFIKETHAAIAYQSVLGGDLAAYQNRQKKPIPYMLLHASVKYLRSGMKNYTYTLEDVTYSDGKEVFVISFQAKPWWKKMGFFKEGMRVEHKGKFFIEADDYAFIKVESHITVGSEQTFDRTFYKRGKAGYYLSNVVHDNIFAIDADSLEVTHKVHIELLVNEIVLGEESEFKNTPITREILAGNVYNPLFWENYVTLTENPLEHKIKRDLEKNQSLEGQFVEKSKLDFEKYEEISKDYVKLRDILTNSKNEVIYIDFWASWCRPCIAEFNASKKIVEAYANKGVRFIYVSVDDRKEKWEKMKLRFGLRNREHLRIGSYSSIIQDYEIKEIPRYMLLKRDGSILKNAPRPTSEEFIDLIDTEIELGEREELDANVK